ncbi:cation:proton antiporter [Lentisphaerota bacterium ZTH]|nr:cation:proton antiporter [Lentisphaerota bacterium]WET06480.1 cation:proton antiporter [Lentisphaerota bacterium ZTH]
MEHLNESILFILGLGVFGGMLGAWFFQKIRIPQVVGYIAIGLLIGEAGFKIVRTEDILHLKTFNLFALGIIGFLVGGELKLDTFRKYARQFTAILLGEGLLAFVLVGSFSFFVVYAIIGNFAASMAAAIVFGAIASATDPASTIDVIWEYRSKGVMTTAIIAIVALDDALAMTLYGLGNSSAQLLTSSSGSLAVAAGHIAIELVGSLVVGAVVAFLLGFFLRWMPQPERGASIAVGMILLVISVAVAWNMDVILAAMMMGFVLTNFAPRRSEDLFKLMRSFSIPIYVLFFVLVGARLVVGKMPLWLWGIVGVYVFGRTLGKMLGAYLGARMTGSPPTVRKYLGLGLFAQGGVAIGLSIMAAEHLANIHIHGGMSMGDMVIFVVTTTTLIVQVLGPPFVKLAVKLANEAGRDITEQDVMAAMKVSDVIDREPVMVQEGDSVLAAVDCFTEHDLLITPVVDKDNKITGILTFDALKDIIGDRDNWAWLLVADIMRPMQDSTTPNAILKDVYDKMLQDKIDQMPVVAEEDQGKPVGMIDIRTIRLKVHAELLKRGDQSEVVQSPATA